MDIFGKSSYLFGICIFAVIHYIFHFSPEKALRDSLTTFETAYLSRSLSRLFDPINLAFSAASLNSPTQEEIEGIARTISRFAIHK